MLLRLFMILMQGLEIPQAMRLGGASASIVISKHSCSDAMPTRTEISAFMETAEEIV